AGVTTLADKVGNTAALKSLTTDPLGSTHINGGLVKTTGDQLYGDAVTIGGPAVAVALTSTASGAVTFAQTLDDAAAGAHDLTIPTAGVTTLADKVGNTAALKSLTTDPLGSTHINGGLVKTTGDQ